MDVLVLFMLSVTDHLIHPLSLHLCRALCQTAQVQFSPDGRWIVSASFDKALKLWDGLKGTFVATFRGHVGPVYQVAWSSDSRLFVSGSKDSTLKVSAHRVPEPSQSTECTPDHRSSTIPLHAVQRMPTEVCM